MIDVYCVCGRRYRVPDDKAGKKLQCRRCGTVQRIPRPAEPDDEDDGFVVPFRTPDESDDDGEGLELRPTGGGPSLELEAEVRRCPSCGFQDDAEVVVCVRCGFDHRLGERLEDAVERAERSGRHAQIDQADDEVRSLSSLAWMALSPLGVVVGPLVVARTLGVERRFRAAGETPPDLQPLRLTASAGAGLWVVVILLFGFLWIRRAERSDVLLARECQTRLERVGRALQRAVAGGGRFPAKGQDLEEAWRLLPGVGADDLTCPWEQGAHAYERGGAELLTAVTRGDYLVLCDPRPHPNALGEPVYRGLRFDGRIEELRGPAELTAARGRSAFPDAPPTPEGDPGPRPSPSPASDAPAGDGPGEAAEAWERQLNRFLAFAGFIDDQDPNLSTELTVSPEQFVDEVGVPPDQLLPRLLESEDVEVRYQAGRMLLRVELTPPDLRRLASRLAADPALRVRLTAARVLRRVGDPSWLELATGVAEAGDVAARKAAVTLMGEEASRGLAGARQVLLNMVRLRQQVGATGDDAIYPLPAEALPHVLSLLADPSVGREARATFFSAGADGLPLLVPAAREGPDRALQLMAFTVLDRLRLSDRYPLADYLALVLEVADPSTQADALRILLKSPTGVPRELVTWALAQLREGSPPPPLRQACRAVIDGVAWPPPAEPTPADDEALAWLVDDLLAEGDHAAILEELAERTADPRIDAFVSERWEDLSEPVRLELIDILGGRPYEGSLYALLRGVDANSVAVRVAALRALAASNALHTLPYRTEAAEKLALRLHREDDPEALGLLCRLASGGLYCALDEDAPLHDCSRAVLRGLQSLARKGNRDAMAAFAAHPNERALSVVLSLLEGTKAAEAPGELLAALQAITGLGSSPAGAAEWKAALSPLPESVATRMRSSWRREVQQLELQRKRARLRIEQLAQQAR